MSDTLDIIFAVSKRIMGKEFTKKNKAQINVYKRAVYYKVSREMTLDSLYAIGDKVERDHATVRHGLKLFDEEIKKKEELQKYLNAYDDIILKVKSKIPIYSYESSTPKDMLQHIVINQRQRIAQLESILSKIPQTIKTMYT